MSSKDSGVSVLMKLEPQLTSEVSAPWKDILQKVWVSVRKSITLVHLAVLAVGTALGGDPPALCRCRTGQFAAIYAQSHTMGWS